MMLVSKAAYNAMIADRDYWQSCAERDRQCILEMTRTYGKALIRSEALQREMAAWVTNKVGDITPEQAAQMFYAQDDAWQAAFFNVMQAQVSAYHEATPGSPSAGVPAGEGQWYHLAKKLDDSGYETLCAMMAHAIDAIEKRDAA